jgi:hypothetical protein
MSCVETRKMAQVIPTSEQKLEGPEPDIQQPVLVVGVTIVMQFRKVLMIMYHI